MPSPPISVYLTTIASQPALRQRQEYLLRILQAKKIPFTSYDLASDEQAKRLWKRKAPQGDDCPILIWRPPELKGVDRQQLPGILVGGQFPGSFSDFEDAVECDELDTLLRLKESYNADEDLPTPAAQPIGVPGAASPSQMTPEHLKSKMFAQMSSPLKGKGSGTPVNKRENEFDVSTELDGYGLQGVKATEDELRALVAELGLDGDDAGELVRGLSSSAHTKDKQESSIEKEDSLTPGNINMVQENTVEEESQTNASNQAASE